MQDFRCPASHTLRRGMCLSDYLATAAQPHEPSRVGITLDFAFSSLCRLAGVSDASGRSSVLFSLGFTSKQMHQGRNPGMSSAFCVSSSMLMYLCQPSGTATHHSLGPSPSANFSIEIVGSGYETERIELQILRRLDCVMARM